jgi:hypothetical protein
LALPKAPLAKGVAPEILQKKNPDQRSWEAMLVWSVEEKLMTFVNG